jgi:hypothetical protein
MSTMQWEDVHESTKKYAKRTLGIDVVEVVPARYFEINIWCVCTEHGRCAAFYIADSSHYAGQLESPWFDSKEELEVWLRVTGRWKPQS